MKLERKPFLRTIAEALSIQQDLALQYSKSLFWELSSDNFVDYLKQKRKVDKQRSIYYEKGSLVLRVCLDAIDINNGRGVHSSVFNTMIEFWNYQQELHLHQNLYNWKVKSFTILLYKDSSFQELNIPIDDQQRILKYLIDGKPPYKFDCQAFIRAAKWLEKGPFKQKFPWKLSLKTESELFSGDCIYLFNSTPNKYPEKDIKHFAYYLWEWLYISKFGDDGPLFICTLQQMHKFYETTEFGVMTVPDKNLWEKADLGF